MKNQNKMKTTLKFISLFALVTIVLFSSCRTEELEFQQAPVEELLQANSTVANLIHRTTTNDGSNDNIIDNSNCFNIQLPITVIVNGIQNY